MLEAGSLFSEVLQECEMLDGKALYKPQMKGAIEYSSALINNVFKIIPLIGQGLHVGCAHLTVLTLL